MAVPHLLDVNVLVPLLWPPHIHHEVAQGWFTVARRDGWASCPLTQLGATRILATPAVSQGTLTVGSAVRLLAEILEDAHHTFWPDDVPLLDGRLAETIPHFQGPNQLTDRYLLALAAEHGGTLATFDGSAGAGLPARSPLLSHLEVITA